MTKLALIPLSSMLIASAAACGSTTPPPKEPEPQVEATSRPTSSGMKVSSELGTINQRGVERTFKGLDNHFDQCEEQGQKRVEVLSGRIAFFIRVGADGTPRYGYLEESTIGDHETEKCFLDAVMSSSFPRPDGGEAEVRYSTGIKPSGGRPPNDWGADKVADAIVAAMPCKAGASVDFQVTMYVVEGSGKSGKVQAVGVAAPNKDASNKIECIIKAIKDAKVPTPGTWPAKVSFKL